MNSRDDWFGEHHRARWWHWLPDGRIQCDLCPRDCRLAEGQHGLCFVRERLGNEMVLATYGRSSGFAVDPIEKKPLFHFLPGSSVLSFGTAGCNLACKFCQNWDISRSREMDTLASEASPLAIAAAARANGCASVAFTYNDPVIFAEYALDTADACHEAGIKTVVVTAGYIHDAPRREFFAKMDAANIDLKSFDEDFYFRLTGAHLQPRARYAAPCAARDRLLARDHHLADSGPQRFRCRDRRDDEMDRE
ncbi:MAG: AmmeMemoRadiSam system radical SAM enzyme [Burkholderiaceae bacterium]